MRGRTILPILGASLLEPSAEQRGPFQEAILCIKGLIFFPSDGKVPQSYRSNY